MLLTWVGVECAVHRRVATSYRLNVNVVSGENPYESTHKSVLLYSCVPPPVSRFEPQHVHQIRTSDKVDVGSNTHTRLHTGYSIEFTSTFDEIVGSSLTNTKVVIKLQHPSRVGGACDHPSWDKNSISHSYNIKDITSYKF